MSSVEAPPLESEAFEDILRRRAVLFGFSATPASFAGLARYLSELDRWRRQVNLTGNLSAEELADHALESALGESLIIHGARLIDIGSGAGFPGVPLSIVRSDVLVTLLEPRAKRAAFLRHVVREIGLSNTTVLEARISDVGGQTFQVATTRAVGNLATLIGSGAFLASRGALLAWTTEPEKAARDLPRFALESLVTIPGSDRRVIAAFRKLP